MWQRLGWSTTPVGVGADTWPPRLNSVHAHGRPDLDRCRNLRWRWSGSVQTHGRPDINQCMHMVGPTKLGTNRRCRPDATTVLTIAKVTEHGEQATQQGHEHRENLNNKHQPTCNAGAMPTPRNIPLTTNITTGTTTPHRKTNRATKQKRRGQQNTHNEMEQHKETETANQRLTQMGDSYGWGPIRGGVEADTWPPRRNSVHAHGRPHQTRCTNVR